MSIQHNMSLRTVIAMKSWSYRFDYRIEINVTMTRRYEIQVYLRYTGLAHLPLFSPREEFEHVGARSLCALHERTRVAILLLFIVPDSRSRSRSVRL